MRPAPSRPRLCTRCRLRWRQDGGLCRRCSVELGELWQMQRLERQAAERPRSPRRRRIRVIDGQPYEVVFDGT